MTVLVTVDGDLRAVTRDVVDGGPFQRLRGGSNSGFAMPSAPLGRLGAGLTLLGGRTISYADLYRTQPYVAAAVDVLTEQVSRLPLKVFRRAADGTRERVYDHRLVDLIERPAPRCSATDLKQWLMQPALLHGNATLGKLREETAGPPTQLWPLYWQAVTPHQKGTPFVSHWETSQFGDRAFFDAIDVLHVRWWAPDGPVGVSPLEKLGVSVRIDQAAQRYQQSYMEKGAAPPSALYLPAEVVANDELKGKIAASMNARHGGPDNAGNVAILPNDTKWEGVGHTAHEAELIDQRKLAREEVGAVYKVPQPFLGILDHATYSNVAELHRMFFTTVLGPWLTMLEETLQAQVIDPEPAFAGLFVEFDLAEVLKGDKLKEINALKLAVQSGLMTVNEARRVQNLPEFDADWCNGPLIPANNLRSEPNAPPSDGDLAERVSDALGRERVLELARLAGERNGN